GDPLDRILHDVLDRLGEEAPVDLRVKPLGGKLLDDVYVGVADPHQEGRLAYTFAQIVTLRAGLGHAREGGELVDHPLDVVDLSHDRVGALVEDLAIRLDELAVFSLETLRRKLDRGQGILDLVGDAARDVRPGGAAL